MTRSRTVALLIRRVALVASFILVGNACEGEVVYVNNIPEESAGNAMTNESLDWTRQQLDSYAQALKIANLKNGDNDEIRFWFTYANFDDHNIHYDVTGYVFSENGENVCSIKYSRKGAVLAKSKCTDKGEVHESKSLLNEMKSLSKYSGRNLACGVTDLLWIHVDGVAEGKRFVLSANNPNVCVGRGSTIVAHILSRVQKLKH